MDTGSGIVQVKTDDIYKDIVEDLIVQIMSLIKHYLKEKIKK